MMIKQIMALRGQERIDRLAKRLRACRRSELSAAARKVRRHAPAGARLDVRAARAEVMRGWEGTLQWHAMNHLNLIGGQAQ